MKIYIGLVDDHQLFLKSLSLLISSLPGFQVVLEALNGKDCIEKIKTLQTFPDILLIDVNMPVMDGAQTVHAIAAKYPSVKMVALSMKSDDRTIISMIRAGCCAYLLKDIHPNELEKALLQIHSSGYYNADLANINYRRLLQYEEQEMKFSFSEREKQFLQLACTELTYKQIADEMNLSPRTIDGYRENLFRKMNVQSRVGLALEAIRRNWVKL
jgi:DNA-binding NarL/FixJ family response regulator